MSSLNVLHLMLPPANVGRRLFANILDLILVFFLSLLIIGKFLIPYQFTDTIIQFKFLLEASAGYLQAGQFSELLSQINENKNILDMFLTMDRWLFFITWGYFVVNGICLKGGSLGKQVFNLRVLKVSTLKPLDLWDGIFRSALFTFLLFTAWPFFMCINLFFICLHSMHQGIHDRFCKTCVVSCDVLGQVAQQLKSQAVQK